MKKIMFIFLCFLFCTCKRQPKIPISNTLEIALGKRYSEYVNLLNKATKKDTIALLQFLKINYINDVYHQNGKVNDQNQHICNPECAHLTVEGNRQTQKEKNNSIEQHDGRNVEPQTDKEGFENVPR